MLQAKHGQHIFATLYLNFHLEAQIIIAYSNVQAIKNQYHYFQIEHL